MWRAGTNGLFMRSLDSTGDAQGNVASSNIQNTHYTDHHNVDEDIESTASQGGNWVSDNAAGTAYRTMDSYYSPTSSDINVASSIMKNSQIIRISMMSTKT